MSSYRGKVAASDRGDGVGFRAVLVIGSAPGEPVLAASWPTSTVANASQTATGGVAAEAKASEEARRKSLEKARLRAAGGKALYEARCAKCHGADGRGDTGMGKKLRAKDYSQAKAWEGLTDEKAVKAIKEGVTANMPGGVTTCMRASEISDADAQAIVAYMRSLKK